MSSEDVITILMCNICLMGTYFIQNWTATARHRVTRKDKEKDKEETFLAKLLRKNLHIIVTQDVKEIILRPKISCRRKETIYVNISATSQYGDRKIMEFIRTAITSAGRSRTKTIQSVQMSIFKNGLKRT